MFPCFFLFHCSCFTQKDHKTGESLCYGFIEFETPEQCEQAYFKMDNTLIDDRCVSARRCVLNIMHSPSPSSLVCDRRVHVDFSQSVAKLWGKYRRGMNMTSEDAGEMDHRGGGGGGGGRGGHGRGGRDRRREHDQPSRPIPQVGGGNRELRPSSEKAKDKNTTSHLFFLLMQLRSCV